MTLSVSYTTFIGKVCHENRSGSESFYVPDTLGSTIALVDSFGGTKDTFGYWPYGEVRLRTGTSQTPFTFLGSLGYYSDAVSRMYVRARYFLRSYGLWLSADPSWPREAPYLYCDSLPNMMTDASGLDCKSRCIDYLTADAIKKFGEAINCILRKCKIGDYACMLGCLGKLLPTGDVVNFLACEWASRSIEGATPGVNPCCPSTDKTCLACCDMQFESCMFRCYTSKGVIDALVCYHVCTGDDNHGQNCCNEVCDGCWEGIKHDCKWEKW